MIGIRMIHLIVLKTNLSYSYIPPCGLCPIHTRQYVPQLQVLLGVGTTAKVCLIPSEIWCIIHTTGSITHGYRHWVKTCVLQLLSEVHMPPCDRVMKRSFTSTRPMILCYSTR